MRDQPPRHRGDLDPVGDLVVSIDRHAVQAQLVDRIDRARPSWHNQAACRAECLEVFFPARGESSAPAKAICETCPVIEPCRAEALADPELDFGVRGGLSARERKAIRFEQRSTP